MRYNYSLLLAGLLLCLTYTTFAQFPYSSSHSLLCHEPTCRRTCATHTQLLEQLRQDTALAYRLEAIERHTEAYINRPKLDTRSRLTIPVVVHVVAHTAAENISDAQINSQIQALNRDFNRLNSDLDKVPSVFKDFVADCGIEFALARRTPDNLPSNGIVRTTTTRDNWLNTSDVKYADKGGDDGWDADRFLNIWVCNMGNSTLGYASFPVYKGPADGVVISYQAFGTFGTARPPYHLGRTLVHEMGHWLNLFHIWGDAVCGDDRVKDTPSQQNPTYGMNGYPLYSHCQAEPNLTMSMNFMDYCYDDQMYFFTKGQKERIWSLFDVGGFREQLAHSNGCTPVSSLSCTQVQTPDVLNIGMDSALVRWLPMDGVQTYKIMYSLDSTDIWLSMKVEKGATSCVLKNMVAGSLYNVKIQALDCPQAVWSNVKTFRTPAIDNQNCQQNFANNNHFETAISIANDISIQSQLTEQNDEDWFKITLSSEKPYGKIILSQLVKDYDIRVYNRQKKLINTALKAGIADEEVILEQNTEGPFWVQIIGYQGVFDAKSCYTLTINTSATPFLNLSRTRLSSPQVDMEQLLIYPNPARGEVYIVPDLQTMSGEVRLILTNARGQKCSERVFDFSKNTPQLTYDISNQASGLYFLTLQTATKIKTEKLMIDN